MKICGGADCGPLIVTGFIVGKSKYEDIYLWRYEAVPELREGLGRYFRYYNEERLHQSLDYQTPAAVYRAR